jgi:hypothetical protein
MSIMNNFTHLSDRELLENIYVLLLEVHRKLDRIDDDDRQVAINLFADLLSNRLQKKSN